MKDYKQIFLISNSVERCSNAKVRVLYLDVQAMTETDRKHWARFESLHGSGSWNNIRGWEFDCPVTQDIGKWFGVFSADTLAPCFTAAPPGEHTVAPPADGTISGVYIVNTCSILSDWGDSM
jgi:hypothetical protein